MLNVFVAGLLDRAWSWPREKSRGHLACDEEMQQLREKWCQRVGGDDWKHCLEVPKSPFS